jgi:hypothetical protein
MLVAKTDRITTPQSSSRQYLEREPLAGTQRPLLTVAPYVLGTPRGKSFRSRGNELHICGGISCDVLGLFRPPEESPHRLKEIIGSVRCPLPLLSPSANVLGFDGLEEVVPACFEDAAEDVFLSDAWLQMT